MSLAVAYYITMQVIRTDKTGCAWPVKVPRNPKKWSNIGMTDRRPMSQFLEEILVASGELNTRGSVVKSHKRLTLCGVYYSEYFHSDLVV